VGLIVLLFYILNFSYYGWEFNNNFRYNQLYGVGKRNTIRKYGNRSHILWGLNSPFYYLKIYIMRIEKIVKKLTKNYPLYSQENVKIVDTLVLVKLVIQSLNINWYIVEYDSTNKIAFGYVEWMTKDPSDDEFGYISISELEYMHLKWIPLIRDKNSQPTELLNLSLMSYVVEVDKHFQPTKFWNLNLRA